MKSIWKLDRNNNEPTITIAQWEYLYLLDDFRFLSIQYDHTIAYPLFDLLGVRHHLFCLPPRWSAWIGYLLIKFTAMTFVVQ